MIYIAYYSDGDYFKGYPGESLTTVRTGAEAWVHPHTYIIAVIGIRA